MLFSRCQRFLTRTVLTALALGATVTSVALAKPSKPGRPGGFRMFAERDQRVHGEPCAVPDLLRRARSARPGSSTVGGGIWPRGSADQYVFGSGINIAGIIEPGDRSVNGFAGDTAGGFFNNTAGTNNGEPVRDIFSSNDPEDAAAWPDEARVPEGDATAELFDPSLQGNIAASQGDLWFVSWEGDPANLASRSHPLGVLVETRAMGWNFPVGNQDIIYFIYTFYNITSTRPEDYAAVRPSLRPLLLEKAADFHALNTAKYGINLPEGGYRINDMFAAFTADMDVAQADANFAGVNVPFSLGYTYENTFSEQTAASLGWTFDPAIFGSAPFFNGVGFVGVKYLGSPIDPETNAPVGLTLFGTFSRSTGSLQDPTDDKQLYRYITGGLLPTDGACSLPNPLEEKICFVNISSPADMRFFQSSGPIDLAPGGFGSITVAYIFAAPVASGNCPGAACNVTPAPNNAALNILGDPTRMAVGREHDRHDARATSATPTAAREDTNTAVVTQEEFRTVTGSLLDKALIAQNVFDNKFLLPFAPDRPEFFLVPGNNQVTVLWARPPPRPTAIRSSRWRASPPSKARRTRCTIRTSGSGTSRGTGSTAAGPTTRRAPADRAVRLCARSCDGQGHLHRLPGADEPDPRMRARDCGVDYAIARWPSRPRCRVSRTSAPWTSTWSGLIDSGHPGQPGAPGLRHGAAPAGHAGHRVHRHRGGPPRLRASRRALTNTRACRSCSSTGASGTACATSTRSPRST